MLCRVRTSLGAHALPLRARWQARQMSSSPAQIASKALRWTLLGTGAAVWLWQLYEWYDPVGADELFSELDGDDHFDAYAVRFYGEDALHSEVDAKDGALRSLLKKLEQQPELEEGLGKEHLALLPGAYGMPQPSRAKPSGEGVWAPSFFLNGATGSCVVDVVMEKNKLHEWTPTSVRVEALERSGRVLLDASAELPHGLTYVHRLGGLGGGRPPPTTE